MKKEKPTYTTVHWKALSDPDKFRDADRIEEAQKIPLTEAQQILQEENKELKDTLKIYNNNANQIVVAEIVGQQKINNSKFIIINKGTSSGVQVGLPVIAEDSFLLGVVGYASVDTAYVALVNDNFVNLSAKIINANEDVQGIVEGRAGLSIIFDLIPKESQIQVGDIVVTSGFDFKIPANLIIGQIESVKDDNNSFFKSAIIKPLALPEEYKYITVVKSLEINSTSTEFQNL